MSDYNSLYDLHPFHCYIHTYLHSFLRKNSNMRYRISLSILDILI